MIDFRYHLVSLIAVFLAVALGIIIGTTQLNDPILTDIRGQVTALEQDKRALEDQTRQLQAQVNTSDTFAEAVAPALVVLVLAAFVAIGSAIAVSAAGRVYLDLLVDQWNSFVFWLENLFT